MKTQYLGLVKWILGGLLLSLVGCSQTSQTNERATPATSTPTPQPASQEQAMAQEAQERNLAQEGVPASAEPKSKVRTARLTGDTCDNMCLSRCKDEYARCYDHQPCRACLRDGQGCEDLSEQEMAMATQACACARRRCAGACGNVPCAHLEVAY